MSGDEDSGGQAETVAQKTARLKEARLQAERDKHARTDRAFRKAAARRKILSAGKPAK